MRSKFYSLRKLELIIQIGLSWESTKGLSLSYPTCANYQIFYDRKENYQYLCSTIK